MALVVMVAGFGKVGCGVVAGLGFGFWRVVWFRALGVH